MFNSLVPKEDLCIEITTLFPETKYLWVYDGEESKVVEAENCNEDEYEGIYSAPTVAEMRLWLQEKLFALDENTCSSLLKSLSMEDWNTVTEPNVLCSYILKIKETLH